MVPHLAGNAGCLLRLAGSPQGFAGIQRRIRRHRGGVKLSEEIVAPDLPPYSLDVQLMELGDDTKAVGLELLETESREPLRGSVAAQIWSAAFPALAAKEFLVVDFFSHLERIREFCKSHDLVFRETASRCLVLTQPSREQLQLVFARFENETFGIRVGTWVEQEDAVLENELSHRGLDAYQA